MAESKAEQMKQTVASKVRGIDMYNPDNLKTLEMYVDVQAKENAYDLEANLAVLKLYQFNQKHDIKIICQILLKALTNFPHTDFILCKCLLNEQLSLHSRCVPLLTQTVVGNIVTEELNFEAIGEIIENINSTFIFISMYLHHKCKEHPIEQIIYLADLLECCDLQVFWEQVFKMNDLCSQVTGFHDSIRKFVCHVVGISFQTIQRPLLAHLLGGVDDNVLRFWVQKYGWKEQSNNIIFIGNQDENVKTKNITEKIDFDNLGNLMANC